MFTELLYDHKYDIDDVIRALCGDDHTGRWLLCTRDGTLVQEKPGGDTCALQDGDDQNHWHVISPLPPSFIQEVKTHYKLKVLPPETRTEILDILNDIKDMNEYFNKLDEGYAGGWLRDRLKDVALEWLDMRGLIPPSMRHVKDDALGPLTMEDAPPRRVKISS
jgi:hypothetical protein